MKISKKQLHRYLITQRSADIVAIMSVAIYLNDLLFLRLTKHYAIVVDITNWMI